LLLNKEHIYFNNRYTLNQQFICASYTRASLFFSSFFLPSVF
jgi:hypothetical protein